MSHPLFCSVPGVPCSPDLTLDLWFFPCLCYLLTLRLHTSCLSIRMAPRLHCPPAPQRCQLSLPATTVTAVSDPASSPVLLHQELQKAPNYVFNNRPAQWSSHLFLSQNLLPLATWPTSFHVDKTHMVIFENVNETVHHPIFFFPHWSRVDLPHTQLCLLPVGKHRKKGEKMQASLSPYQSPVRNSLTLNIEILPPLPVLAWNLEYLSTNLYGAPGAVLAGSHVILICFYHGNSKLKQLAGRRQAVHQ